MQRSRRMSSGSGSGGGGGGWSPTVKQDLARLEMSPDVRRGAMVSLRARVEQLDQASMPRFLAQVSEWRTDSSLASAESRTHAISLYEDVARVHGALIGPHIARIAATIVRSLSSSGSSLHLQEACARVAAAILRYACQPEDPGDTASFSGSAATTFSESGGSSSSYDAVFRDLVGPLADALVSKMEPLAAGAALCLQALVESEKWKYAPVGVVADLFARSAHAFRERSGQTVPHLRLARSLVKANSCMPVVQLFGAAREVLLLFHKPSSPAALSWQHKASVLQLMSACALRMHKDSVDAAELEPVLEVVEKLKVDRMPSVRTEAVKAAQALKVLVSGEQLQQEQQEQQKQVVLSCCSQESHQLVSCSPPPLSSTSSCSKPVKHARHLSLERQLSSASSTEELWFVSRIDSEEDGEVMSGHSAGDAFPQTCEPPQRSTSLDRYANSYLMEDEDTCTPITKLHSMFSPQKKGDVLTADDFMRFTTPRRLVRSLQSQGPSPIMPPPSYDAAEDEEEADVSDRDAEALSETGWSVRDNPIAEGSDEELERSCKQRRKQDDTKASSDGSVLSAEKISTESDSDNNPGNQARKDDDDHSTGTGGLEKEAGEDLASEERSSGGEDPNAGGGRSEDPNAGTAAAQSDDGASLRSSKLQFADSSDGMQVASLRQRVFRRMETVLQALVGIAMLLPLAMGVMHLVFSPQVEDEGDLYMSSLVPT